MRKLISIFSLILPMSVFAANIGVFNSGIDWTASTLTITEFKGIGTNTDFKCLGATHNNMTANLKDLFTNAVDEAKSGSETNNTVCETAGNYTFKIKLVDTAGNSSEKEYKLKVFPSDADHMNLSYPDCDSDNGKIADGSTGCEISVEVFDQFDNIFAKFNDGSGNRSENSNVELAIQNREYRSKFNYFAEDVSSDDLFRDGIIPPLSPSPLDDSGKGSLEIKAKAPSIDIIQGSDRDSKVSFLTSKKVDLEFKFDSVKKDGTLNSNSKTTLQSFGDFKFYPWVKVALSDPDRDPDAGLENLEIDGSGSEIEIRANTGVNNINLPNNLKTKLIGVPSAIKILLADDNSFNTTMNLTGGTDLSWNNWFGTDTKNKFLKLEKDTGILSLVWGITTKIKHKTIDGKDITYPGGNLGETAFWKEKTEDPNYNNSDCLHCDTSDLNGHIAFIGADIEGQIKSNQSIYGLGEEAGGHILNMGGVSAKDSREKIEQSASALYRGLEPISDANLTTGINFDEYSTGVAYFKEKTVKLGGTIEGVGTIIVVDGNILIEDDMEYDNPTTDSLGIILINTKIGKPADKDHVLQTGNIFVQSDVKKMVGTYFADGSLLSTTIADSVDTPYENSYSYPGEMTLGNQLLLKGTIFSYNTLGGFMVGNDEDGYFTPWGGTTNENEAKTYDIHYIRRYDGSGSSNCVTNTNNGVNCDKNKFAFVIRPDGKVKNQTPPGFSNAATSYR